MFLLIICRIFEKRYIWEVGEEWGLTEKHWGKNEVKYNLLMTLRMLLMTLMMTLLLMMLEPCWWRWGGTGGAGCCCTADFALSRSASRCNWKNHLFHNSKSEQVIFSSQHWDFHQFLMWVALTFKVLLNGCQGPIHWLLCACKVRTLKKIDVYLSGSLLWWNITLCDH